jgi:hypothetical protein
LWEAPTKEYLKDQINYLTRNSKNKNIRELKRGYQPRSNLMKDKNGNVLADSHNILNRWKNYFSQILNVHNVSNYCTVGCSSFEVELAITK